MQYTVEISLARGPHLPRTARGRRDNTVLVSPSRRTSGPMASKTRKPRSGKQARSASDALLALCRQFDPSPVVRLEATLEAAAAEVARQSRTPRGTAKGRLAARSLS